MDNATFTQLIEDFITHRSGEDTEIPGELVLELLNEVRPEPNSSH